MGLLIVRPCRPVGADVGDAVGVEIAREIPGRDDGLAAAADLGRVDLAVEVPAADHALTAVPALQAPMVNGALVAAGLTATWPRFPSPSAGCARDRAIADAGEPGQPRIEARLDLIPGEWTQRLSGRDRGETALAIAKPEGERAGLIDDQA